MGLMFQIQLSTLLLLNGTLCNQMGDSYRFPRNVIGLMLGMEVAAISVEEKAVFVRGKGIPFHQVTVTIMRRMYQTINTIKIIANTKGMETRKAVKLWPVSMWHLQSRAR